jgi:hypothetical protein
MNFLTLVIGVAEIPKSIPIILPAELETFNVTAKLLTKLYSCSDAKGTFYHFRATPHVPSC